MPLDVNAIKERLDSLLQSDGVQNLKTQVSDGLSRAGAGLTDLRDRAGEIVQSEDIQAMLPYLLSGGAGAAAGALSTGRQRESKGEDRSGYLRRVLRNALATGGLAAGGHYLVNKGLDNTVGGLTESAAGAAPGANEGPLETTVKNIAFSPLTALGAGATALHATHNMRGIGAGKSQDAFLDRFTKENPSAPSASQLKHTATAKEIGDIERAAGPNYDARARRMAGLPSDMVTPGKQGFLGKIPGVTDVEGLKGKLSTAMRRGPLSTFGQSSARRAGRGALGLAAAGIPALLGALLTEPSNN